MVRSTMKVQLVEIKPQNKTNYYDVSVLVGKNRHIFPVQIQETKIDESVIQVAGSGRYRWETLQYNAGVISQIDRLVLKVYNGQDLSLPITITEYLPKSPILTKKAQVNGHHAGMPKGLDVLSSLPALQTT